MGGIRPEPLALEVALACYVAGLPDGACVALEEIAARFGCSVREAEDALRVVLEVEDGNLTTVSGATIEDGRLVKYVPGGYGEHLRCPVRLSPVQARAALVALDLVSRASDPGILAGLRNKIYASAGPVATEIEVGKDFDDGIPISAAIERARRERRVLEIRYPSEKTIKTRAVEPIKVSAVDGFSYLIAHCRYAGVTRAFQLDRVLSARITEERFTERRDEAELPDAPPRPDPPRRAVIRFSPEASRELEKSPELELLREHDDGSTDHALYYTDAGWAAARVMRHLGEAVVVEPEELRREVHRRAASLLEAYRDRKQAAG